MEARLRGTFLISAGVLFASIGFTLSVLSTFLRLFLPRYSIRSADAKLTTSRRCTTRRTSQIKHRRRNGPSTSNSSISSLDLGSNWSSEASGSPKSELKLPQRRLEPPRAGIHNRVESEYIARPDFRSTVNHNRRRSESTPPSPAPWVSSHSAQPESSTRNRSLRSSEDHAVTDGEGDSTLHPPRVPSFEGLLPLNSRSRTGLSFLRRKVHKSAPNGFSAAAEQSSPPPISVSPVERRRSLILAPLLHRRKSQPVDMIEFEGKRRSQPPSQEDDASFVDGRPSQESCRLATRRSQTLRTQPYDAPYFFPAPGSVAAETYLPPRRRPVRSKTLHPDETSHVIVPAPPPPVL